MNQFVTNFDIPKVETEIVETAAQGNDVLKINGSFLNFKILNNNIRSLSKNLEYLEIFLSHFDEPFECIILTETWKIDNINMYKIEGYDILYNEGVFNQNDGIVIYIKNNLNYTYQIDKINNVSVINLNIQLVDYKINIIAVYKSPSINSREFIIDLYQYLKSAKTTADYKFILGDLNIDIMKKNEISSEFLNTLCEYGYKSTINKYTRVDGDSKTCIDHIFINSKHPDVDEKILPLIIESGITDHFPVILQLVLGEIKTQTNKNNFIKFINYKTLKRELTSYDWNNVITGEDLDAETNKFINKLTALINKHTKTIINKNKKRKVWITRGIITSINKRDRLQKKCKNDPNNREIRNEYTTYRNKLTEIIKKTKYNFYKTQIEVNKDNMKRLWETVNYKIKNGNKKDKSITQIINGKNEIIKNKSEMCDIFNNEFINIGKTLANKIKQKIDYKEKKRANVHSVFLYPCTGPEIKEYITRLKNKKAPGFDNIKSETLKEIVEYIITPLTYLVNKSFSTGVCPEIFKISVVKPIHKAGDRKIPLNYRPISLISSVAKVFEMALKDRILKFLDKYNILSEQQFGFREGKSTENAITLLTKKIYKALDNSKPSLCLFLDLAKAFDTISHTLLLTSLEEVGIRGTALTLICSYLTNRKQCVEIDGTRSGFLKIEYGVPQGTILGPILFILYLNNLFEINSEGTVISFADDTAIFYESDTWNNLREKVQNDFINIKQWFDYKLLSLNFDKTVYIPFTSYNSTLPQFQSLQVKDEDSNSFEISSKSHTKYLGLFIDCHLRWDNHINFITEKLRVHIHLFKFLKQVLDIKYLRIIYMALVEPHIRYGIIGWGGVMNVYLKKLELTQKRIIKIMYDKEPTYPTDLLFKESSIMDVRQLFFLSLAVLQYSDTKTILKHEYNTRNRKNLVSAKLMLKTIGQRSHVFLAPKTFNFIPETLKNITNKKYFTKHVKRFIMDIPRNDINNLLDFKNT